jgi:cellulose synthase/poly-beta-1,6-N-acetylglucosamine synthase-like glycosyltransferase
MLIDLTARNYKDSYVELEGEASFYPYFPTANVAFRREALIKAGGFDKNIKGNGEDVDASIKMIKHGHRLWLEPEAKVSHCHRETVRDLVIQWAKYGKGWPFLYLKYVDVKNKLAIYVQANGRCPFKIIELNFFFPVLIVISRLLLFYFSLFLSILFYSLGLSIPAALLLVSSVILITCYMKGILSFQYLFQSSQFALLRLVVDTVFLFSGIMEGLRLKMIYFGHTRQCGVGVDYSKLMRTYGKK